LALNMARALGDAFANMCNGDGKYAFYVRRIGHGTDTMADPSTLSAIDAAAAIRSGQLTSERLVEACLARIEEREGMVGAWAYINPDQALTEARARDKQEPKGLLHGVPVGIKDVIDTADMPTEYGSPIYKDHQPACDAACVAQVRESGGVILGKTVSTEFATRYAGKTRNPHNTDHTPGGSSSGSGAAVADCMVPLAFGTQTTGSHIRPASYCGIVGYKPSFNMIDRAGLKQLSQSFDTLGVHGRTVKDTALVVTALADFHVPENAWEIAGTPKIAFCRTPVWDEADASTQALVEEAASRLGAQGAKVVDVSLPAAFDQLADVHTTISEFEFCRALTYERTHFLEMLSEHLRGRLEHGMGWTRAEYDAAWRKVAHCAGLMEDVFNGYDVILAPSVPGEAPRFEEGTGSPIFSQFWTPLGLPCVNVPVLEGPTGLPIGIQFLAPLGEDARALTHADWVHRKLGS
jgi:Asp-tRNA(Asn)/Glu-tRNA(Gln) amidotransferase A subunit family amidase